MPRLLHLIYRKGDPAASLDIVREPVKKRFIFKDGVPVAAGSNILNEVLGRLLMQEGIISQRDYEQSLEVVLREKKKHGQVLIAMGLLTPEQLDTFLMLQVKRRVFKIFGWNEGTYRYVRSAPGAPELPALPLHPAALILEGISLGFYPAARIRSDLKAYMDLPVSVAADSGRYILDDFNLNLQEKRFLDSIDGRKTLREVLDASDLLRHRALSLALSFLITGVITSPAEVEEEDFFEEETRGPEAAEAPLDRKLNAEILFMKAKSALEKGDYSAAVKTLAEITDLNPMEGEYWAYLGWAIYLEDPASRKKAERVLKDAIDLNNDLDIAWHFLGMLSLASGDTEMARSYFSTAVQKNPWMLQSVAELKRLEISGTVEPGPDLEERKAYVKAFGFTDDPFTRVPYHRYAFLSGSRHEAMESLVRAVKKRSGPVLLTGAAGTGKTTLALELLRRLANEKVLPAVILRPSDRELILIKEINAEIGVTADSDSIKEQLLALGMRVSQNKIQGGHTLLVIDQAHHLTPGCLKLVQFLTRLKSLQIVLSAEPSIDERLKGPEFTELDNKIAARVQLHSLSMDETKDYFLKRLNEGYGRKKPACSISDEALVLLFEESGGIPSEINSKAARLLSESAAYGTCEIDNIIAMAAFGRKNVFEDEAAAEVFVEKAFEETEVTAAVTPPSREDQGEPPTAPQSPEKAPPPMPEGKGETLAGPKAAASAPPAHRPLETKQRKQTRPALHEQSTSKLLIVLLFIAIAGLIAAFFSGALRFGGFGGGGGAPETVVPGPADSLPTGAVPPGAPPTLDESGPLDTSAAFEGTVEERAPEAGP
jgi:general secretion pathway protein A